MLEEIDWSTREIKVRCQCNATHMIKMCDVWDVDLRVRVSRHGQPPEQAD